MESEISSSEVLSVRLLETLTVMTPISTAKSTTASRCHPLAELSVEIGVITVSVSSTLTERTSDDDISCRMQKNEIADGGSCSLYVPI